MDMRSLNRSLPPTTAASKAPENLLRAFKDAALSVTKLYKEAASSDSQARQAGYQDALDELLAFLDKENIGLGDGEGWTVRQWATERLDDGYTGSVHNRTGGGTRANTAGSESDEEHETNNAEKQDDARMETNNTSNESTHVYSNPTERNDSKKEDAGISLSSPAREAAASTTQAVVADLSLSSSPPQPALKTSSSTAFTFRSTSHPYPQSTSREVDMNSTTDTPSSHPSISLTTTSTTTTATETQTQTTQPHHSLRTRSLRSRHHNNHRSSRSSTGSVLRNHEMGVNLQGLPLGGGTPITSTGNTATTTTAAAAAVVGSKRKFAFGDFFDLGDWKDSFGGGGGGGPHQPGSGGGGGKRGRLN